MDDIEKKREELKEKILQRKRILEQHKAKRTKNSVDSNS